MFSYIHLAPASEGLRNSPSTRYSPSTGPIMEFSAPVFQGRSSQLFLYQPSLPPSLLFSILYTPSQNCCLHKLPCWPQQHSLFSLPPFSASYQVPPRQHRVQPDHEVLGNELELCAMSHPCCSYTLPIRNATFLEWWSWLTSSSSIFIHEYFQT